MAIANASMLDEATAAAEAMTLCQRDGQESRARASSSPTTCSRRRIDVVRTRAAPLGIEVVVGPAASAAASPTRSRCCCNIRAPNGDVRDYRALADAVHATRRLRRRRRRPARAHAAGAAGRMGRRRRRRLDAALRRADGLRRPARRLSRHARRIQALDAGAPRRRHRRCRRRSRVPPRAADARAAHPPRKGDVEHLHGAGAAGGDGEHVRGLSRRRRA